MLGTVFNIFRIQDLRNKILFTVALLIMYRVGFHIPVPGFRYEEIENVAGSRESESPLGRAAEYMQMFTGGTLERSSLFGLGIMPYITASIILMLLGNGQRGHGLGSLRLSISFSVGIACGAPVPLYTMVMPR